MGSLRLRGARGRVGSHTYLSKGIMIYRTKRNYRCRKLQKSKRIIFLQLQASIWTILKILKMKARQSYPRRSAQFKIENWFEDWKSAGTTARRQGLTVNLLVPNNDLYTGDLY